jgi:hypothetical protein
VSDSLIVATQGGNKSVVGPDDLHADLAVPDPSTGALVAKTGVAGQKFFPKFAQISDTQFAVGVIVEFAQDTSYSFVAVLDFKQIGGPPLFTTTILPFDGTGAAADRVGFQGLDGITFLPLLGPEIQITAGKPDGTEYFFDYDIDLADLSTKPAECEVAPGDAPLAAQVDRECPTGTTRTETH